MQNFRAIKTWSSCVHKRFNCTSHLLKKVSYYIQHHLFHFLPTNSQIFKQRASSSCLHFNISHCGLSSPTTITLFLTTYTFKALILYTLTKLSDNVSKLSSNSPSKTKLLVQKAKRPSCSSIPHQYNAIPRPFILKFFHHLIRIRIK